MNSYKETWRAARDSTRQTAVNTAWAHWSALGSMAYGSELKTSGSIVDPESLVFLSLAYVEDERRLQEMVSWWARVGSPLTSLNRMKSVMPEFGGRSPEYFSSFARLAASAGHRNWIRHANDTLDMPRPIKATGPDDLTLRGASSLMVRLRAAFGVSAKPDILSYLIGNRDSASSVAQISQAVGYTKTAIRDSLKDMVTAGLVLESSSHPANYSTNRTAWRELLDVRGDGLSFEPRWCHWTSIFGFLVSTRVLLAEALEGESNDHLLASKARDIVERHVRTFDYHGIQRPPLSEYRGREFADAFLAICENIASWKCR